MSKKSYNMDDAPITICGVIWMQVFPVGYPGDLLDRILLDGGSFEAHFAYRVAKYGAEDPQSYLSTFQEKQLNPVRLPSQQKPDKSISTYSTSLSVCKDRMTDYCHLSMRNYPRATVVEGKTEPVCGPSKLNSKTGHVDWWLFADAKPWLYFRETRLI